MTASVRPAILPAAVTSLAMLAFLATARTAISARWRLRVRSRLGHQAPAGTGGAGRLPSWAPAWLGPRLAAAGWGADPARVWAAWTLATAVAVMAAAAGGGPGLGALALAVSAGAPALVLHLRRGHGDARYEAALPLALEAVARSLRSGASLPGAVREAGESAAGAGGPDHGAVGADLVAVARRARTEGMIQALEGWSAGRPLPGVRLAVAALALGADTGGAQARAIDGVGASLRQRTATAAEVRALSSQARLSALVIALAPLGFCLVASTGDRRTASFLFRTRSGLGFLCLGLLLDAMGAWWMAWLTRSRP